MFWSPSSCSIVMLFFLHLKSCWNAELPQVSFFYIWEPVIVSKPGWASICALSILLFLVSGPKKLLELPGIYGKSGDRRSNCIFILDCSPQPCWPCSLSLTPRFHKGRVVVQQCTLYDKGKVYCFYIKNPLLYNCVTNEIDGVQLYSCPSSVFVGSRGNGERCLFAESARLRWVSGFPWYTYSCMYNVCCIKWTRRENEPCYVCWRLVHIFFPHSDFNVHLNALC